MRSLTSKPLELVWSALGQARCLALRALKSLEASAGDAVFSCLTGRRRPASAPRLRDLGSILVVQPADVGDVVLSGPLLRELRRLLPEAWIGLAVQPRTLELVELCPYVDEVMPFDWRSTRGWLPAIHGRTAWWLEGARLASRRLWGRCPEAAILPRFDYDSGRAASLILMTASGAKWRIAGRDASLSYRSSMDRLITHGPELSASRHEVERQMSFIEYLGGEPHAGELEAWTSREDEEFAEGLLRKSGLLGREPLVALAPGAQARVKLWPVDRFAELARRLERGFGAGIVVLGAPAERRLGGAIERALPGGCVLDAVGRTTLRQATALVRHCKVLVGNDSGPMHLGAAAGASCVGLFGPGDHVRFRPWGEGHQTLFAGLDCSPCPQRCRFDRPLCMERISVDQVERAAAVKLASSGSAGHAMIGSAVRPARPISAGRSAAKLHRSWNRSQDGGAP